MSDLYPKQRHSDAHLVCHACFFLRMSVVHTSTASSASVVSDPVSPSVWLCGKPICAKTLPYRCRMCIIEKKLIFQQRWLVESVQICPVIISLLSYLIEGDNSKHVGLKNGSQKKKGKTAMWVLYMCSNCDRADLFFDGACLYYVFLSCKIIIFTSIK